MAGDSPAIVKYCQPEDPPPRVTPVRYLYRNSNYPYYPKEDYLRKVENLGP